MNAQTAQLWQQVGALEWKIIQRRLAALQQPTGNRPAATGQAQGRRRTAAQAADATATRTNSMPGEEELWQQIGNLFREILQADLALAVQTSRQTPAGTTVGTANEPPQVHRVLRPETGSGVRLNFTPGRAQGDIRLQRTTPSQNLPPNTDSATPQATPGTGVSRSNAGTGAVPK